MFNKKVFGLILSISFSCVLSVAALTNTNSFMFGNAADSNTIITLDKQNAPTIINNEGTLVYNDYATFIYTNAAIFNEGHVTLGTSGTITKDRESKSLKSVVATFAGDLTLNSGFANNDYCFTYELTSTVPQSIRGNYFEITSPTGADITELVFSFGCLEAEPESHHMEWNSDETHHWKECTDEHCHKITDYGEHVESRSGFVAPTKETTGQTGTVTCSVCQRILEENRTLPVLSDADYNITYDTRLISDEVRDVEVYTWKVDANYSFTINGDVLTEYIHAGTSYYSINRWNEIFTNQTASVETINNKKHLTIELKTGTTTTIVASDGVSALDGKLDFTLYESVTITGDGTMDVTYSVAQDGIEAYSLTINEGTTVNLTGYDSTQKSGIKIYKLLQVDGTFNISNFYCGHAIANTDSNTAPYDVAINVGSTGKYNISKCSNGIYAWSSFKKTISITIYGELSISAYSESADTFTMNNKTGAISGGCWGSGICLLKSEATLTVFGKLDIKTVNALAKKGVVYGHGIVAYKGFIYFRDNANVLIDCTGNAVYAFAKFIVAGSNNASEAGNVNLTLKTKYGNGLYSYESNTAINLSIAFHTLGTVLIENTYEELVKTGIQIANKGKSGDLYMIKCADMTIKGFNYATGSWKTGKAQTITYTYDGDYDQLHIVNCLNIFNNPEDYGNSTFYSLFNENTVDISMMNNN